MIELLQFASTVEVLRVQSLDSLRLQRPDDCVVRIEDIAEHRIAVVNRRRRPTNSSTTNILVRVIIDILDGR